MASQVLVFLLIFALIATIIIGVIVIEKENREYAELSRQYRVLLQELIELKNERIEERCKPIERKMQCRPNKVVPINFLTSATFTSDAGGGVYIDHKPVKVRGEPIKETFEDAFRSACNYVQGNYVINKSKVAELMNEFNTDNQFSRSYTTICGRFYLTAYGITNLERMDSIESLFNDIMTNTLHVRFKEKPNVISMNTFKFKNVV